MLNRLRTINNFQVLTTDVDIQLNGAVIGKCNQSTLSELSKCLHRIPIPEQSDSVAFEDIFGGNLKDINQRLQKCGTISSNKIIIHCTRLGWRNELYPIFDSDGHVQMTLERSCSSLLGIRVFGCHLNAYTDDGRMWIARRNLTKQTYPGMLDNMAAGGIGADCFMNPVLERKFEIKENMIRECAEEAGMPRHIAENARYHGAVSFHHSSDCRGIVAETNYVFDLQVPSDYQPTAVDGEVDSFSLLSIQEVNKKIVSGEFAPGAATTIIDFMIRHGYITPQNEPDYDIIVQELHPSSVSDLPGPRI